MTPKALILFAVLLLATTLAQCQTDPFPEQQQQQQTNDKEYRSSPAPIGNLFNFIMSPIKRTIEHAKHFLGNRLETATGGMDAVRLQTFRMFMQLYNKTYPLDEIPHRMELFFERRKAIEESVQMFREGKSMFTMRENEFIDWDDDELKRLTGVALPPRNELAREAEETQEQTRFARSIYEYRDDNNRSFANNFITDDDSYDEDDLEQRMNVMQGERIPAKKDWRDSGCISPPINQMKCGACYAIATMSVLESMRCINRVSSPILSPQQVVDCSTPRAGYSNYGCDGGWPTRVLKYLQDVRIAAREICYPFVRRQTTCRLNQVQANSGCTVSSSPTDSRLQYKVLNNERDILYHVAKTGPVVTVMKASDKFLYYGSGIFDDPRCSRRRDDVDHAIVITGYGRENGVDYWIIKNSWGITEWGEQGFAKYKRGTNACSIGHWGWVLTA